MEAFEMPPFLWVTEPVERCLVCEGPVRVQQVEVELIGGGARVHAAELARCRDCGQWYGMIGLLVDLLNTDDVDPDQLKGRIRVDGEELSFGIDAPEEWMAHEVEAADLFRELARELGLEDLFDEMSDFTSLAGLLGEWEGGDGLALPDPPGPYFAQQDEQAVRTFMKAARRFYQARPWRRLEGHKYLAARFGEGPWRYFNVMGQEEEAPGVSYFEDWLQLCRFLHNMPNLFEQMAGAGIGRQLRAAGAAESVILFAPEDLAEEDLALLEDLGVEPLRDGYPMPTRITPDRFTLPQQSIEAYTVVLEAVVEAVEKRRASPVTSIKEAFTIEGLQVDLRYPSKGSESLPDPPGAYRLVVHGKAAEQRFNALPPSHVIELEASGAETAEGIIRAIHRHGDDYWAHAFGSGEHVLWSDDFGRGAPSPYLAQLRNLDDLWIEIYEVRYPVEIQGLGGEVPQKIRVAVHEK